VSFFSWGAEDKKIHFRGGLSLGGPKIGEGKVFFKFFQSTEQKGALGYFSRSRFPQLGVMGFSGAFGLYGQMANPFHKEPGGRGAKRRSNFSRGGGGRLNPPPPHGGGGGKTPLAFFGTPGEGKNPTPKHLQWPHRGRGGRVLFHRFLFDNFYGAPQRKKKGAPHGLLLESHPANPGKKTRSIFFSVFPSKQKRGGGPQKTAC